MITKEQEEALHELECNTHILWTPEAAIKLTEPFGFKCHSHIHEAEGMMLENGRPVAKGASSWSISGQIAIHYDLRPAGKIGRGSQVREDCRVIREHLKNVK